MDSESNSNVVVYIDFWIGVVTSCYPQFSYVSLLQAYAQKNGEICRILAISSSLVPC